MKKIYKPGERLQEFQMKKKAHEMKMAYKKAHPVRKKKLDFYGAGGPRVTDAQVNMARQSLPQRSDNLGVGLAKMGMLRQKTKGSKKHKNWIANAIKKPGALHEEMGVPEGKKIPAKALAKATKKGGKEGKRARLAETLKGFKHKKAKISSMNQTGFAGRGMSKMMKPSLISGNSPAMYKKGKAKKK